MDKYDEMLKIMRPDLYDTEGLPPVDKSSRYKERDKQKELLKQAVEMAASKFGIMVLRE